MDGFYCNNTVNKTDSFMMIYFIKNGYLQCVDNHSIVNIVLFNIRF